MNLESDNKEPIIEHFKSGYQNAQEVIRFIDTKTEILSGIVLAFLGGILVFLLNVLEMDKDIYVKLLIYIQDNIYLCTLLMLSILFGLVALFSCLLTLIARKPPKFGPPYFVLFPHVKKQDYKKAISYYENILKSTPDKVIAEEYQYQLVIVGIILNRKMFWLKIAIYFFIAQLIAISILAILLIVPIKLSISKIIKDKASISLSSDNPIPPSSHAPNIPSKAPNAKQAP